MEQRYSPLSVENVPGKHCVFSTYIAKRTRAQSGASAEVQFPDYGTELWSMAVEIVPGKTAISAPILPREREVSLEHGQMCIFLIMAQSSGPLAVEMVPRKH
jgi:hypothetical protein